MNREILLLVDALAREKNVDKEIVFNSIVNAHLAAVDDNGYVILE